MGLDLWFRDDVARILAAAQETMGAALSAVAPLGPEEVAYRRGFEDALRAVGVAFGVASPQAQARAQWQVLPGIRVVDVEDACVRRNGGHERGP